MPRQRDKPLTVKIRIDGAKETLRAFRQLPKAASVALRDRTQELSKGLASKVKAAAIADSAQSALIAPTVRARRDRVPSIVAGGTRKVGRNKVSAHKVLFGSEFGSNHMPQFRPHRGQSSYWFFKTVEDEQRMIEAAWNKTADDIIDEFGGL